MKLTVVIVSYNVRHYLEQCIVSVRRAAQGIDHQIIVVDNASHDDTVSHLSRRFKDAAITIIESRHNLGFARANNIAIRQTQSQYVLLLNPDTFVAEDSLTQVLAFMDTHPKAGGVGVKMHNADGTLARESRRSLPTPWVSLLKMLGFSRRYYMSHLSWDEPGQIEVLSGAFCMLRREALDQVGLLDEDFFMYGEDIDLSFRIRRGGWENWYVPAAIVHYKGESTQKSSYRYVHVFYQAMLIFFRKHYSHQSFFVTIPIKLAIYFRACLAVAQMLCQRLRRALGFDAKAHTPMNYCFIGSAPMIEQCRSLARRRGLTARFVQVAPADPSSPAEGIAAGASSVSRTVEVPSGAVAGAAVYDTDLFSFSQIIAHASSPASGHALIGTYSSETKTIITQREIIQ